MPLRLYVIRHSVRELPAESGESPDGDPEAELTSEGEEIAGAVGKWLADNEEIPSRIIASATVRTQQTAELLAKALSDAGYAPPDVETDVSIGPHQSVRGLVQKLAADKAQDRIIIVSHHESIMTGLKALSIDNGKSQEVDKPSMGELRILRVRRGSERWKEKMRLRPSDLGYIDHY